MMDVINSSSKYSLFGVGICNLLMASIFALSASYQFNDSDWYFWIPLYVAACLVNLVKWAKKPNSRMRRLAKFAMWLGIFLFIKVTIEKWTRIDDDDEFWSLNMRERMVRENIGSGLAVSSMFLLLLQNSSNPRPRQITKHGMPILVGVAYGLSFFFFAFQHQEMKY